mmetsp:Transcript_18869/g.18025  ORF Transcript_18869/g.18025 Transcript_18869/m.18025 type:complete len:86 (+) Transcript_18869:354-611(+)
MEEAEMTCADISSSGDSDVLDVAFSTYQDSGDLDDPCLVLWGISFDYSSYTWPVDDEFINMTAMTNGAQAYLGMLALVALGLLKF